MKRIAYLTLSLGSASLLILLLVLTIGAQGSDHVGDTIIQVPDDYLTIQAAIDAAADGDTIQVAAGDYKENLAISEGITLSGGWDPTFNTRQAGDSKINGQGLGRVISITCSLSDTVVTIDGFTIWNGDASGFGMSELPGLSDPGDHTVVAGLHEGAAAQGNYSLDPAEQAAELRGHLIDLAARDLYPGGEHALQSVLEQLEWRTAQAEQARTLANSMPALDKTSLGQDPGAGGGIYSWNASLHLLNSTIEDNVGGTNVDGYGGGIFAGQAATGGTLISGNVVKYNTASMYAAGRGGGLYLFWTPSAVVEDNLFLENAGSSGGMVGTGGGLYVNESSKALVQRNQVLRNTAHASWNCSGWGGGGTAGGAQIRASDGAIVKDNLFHNNLSALHCGSHTGGLYLYKGANVQVSGNELIDNWGVLFQIYTDDYGGGLGLDTLDNATVTGNTVRSNITSLASPESGWNVSYGGGIYGHALVESQVMSNNITANTASVMRTAFGGGVYMESTGSMVMVSNIINDNSASLSDSGGGTGGGLDFRNTVSTLIQGNQIEGNRASAAGYGAGGALELASYGPLSINNTVDANFFLDNQASGDEAEGSQGGACVIYSHGFAFTNNVVAGNSAYEAGGLLLGIAEYGEISNNTMASNSDAAVLLAEWTTPVTFTNNIIVDHTVGISVTEAATATLRYTLWDGNDTNIGGSGTFTNTHPVSGDPAFAGPDAGDYHLTVGSTAINAGDPAGVPPAPAKDLDDVARPQGTAVDIGAYEWPGYWQHLPVVATVPHLLGIVPSQDYILNENFDGSWPGWNSTEETYICMENCDEWKWNKSWDSDYDGDGDARINCNLRSADIGQFEYGQGKGDYSSCRSTLHSPEFDASACSDTILYIDENYKFSRDDWNDEDQDCSMTRGLIAVENDTGWHRLYFHNFPAASDSYVMGRAYDISRWAAGKSGLRLSFDAEGYLNRYFWAVCSNSFFKTFWRIDNVKVKCLIAQPDGTIAPHQKDPVGRGVYNSNGDDQTVETRVDAGETAVFDIQWWNDGNYDSDNFIISGPGDAPGWTVRYFDEYPGTDITGEVTGDGWTAENISGGQETIRVEITADNSLNFGDFYELLVTGSSMHDSGKVDAVKAIVPFGGVQLSVELDSINEGASGRVTSDPAGIDCTDSCQAEFAPGTEVTLTAVPDTGYVLHYWSGSSYSTESTIKVTMDGDKSLKASFSRPVIVTPEAGPGGSISPSEATEVLIGSETFWQVTPDTGYQIKDVSISEGSSTCWLDSRGAPTYRLLVADEPSGYACTLSAAFNSQP